MAAANRPEPHPPPPPAEPLPWPVRLYLAALLIPLALDLGPLVLSGLRLLLLALVLPLLLALLRGRFGRLLPADLLMLAHLGWATLALLLNNAGRGVEYAGASGVEILGGYLLARAYIRSAAAFVALLKSLAALLTLTLPAALFEALAGQPIVLTLLARLPGFHLALAPAEAGQRLGLFRAQVVFAHPIHYGLFAALVCTLCLVGLRGLWPAPMRLALAAGAGLAVLLSLSSGALLALALQLGLIAWAWLLRATPRRWLILLGLAALAYLALDLGASRSPYRVFLSYATFNPATAYWRALTLDWGLVNIGRHPLFGLGLNDWARPAFMISPSVDNFWLLTAMRYGLPGFLTLVLGLLWALLRIGRRDLDADPWLWQLRRAWMIAWVGLGFALATVDVWAAIQSFVFFLFGAGLWFTDAGPAAAPASAGLARRLPPRPTPAPLPFTRFGPTGPAPGA